MIKILDKMIDDNIPIVAKIFKLSNLIGGGIWNYRIIEKSSNFYKEEKYYELYEVYYNEKGEIWALSQEPMSIWFENKKELKTLLKQIKDATKRTILKMENDDLIDTGKYLKQIKVR